MTIPATITLGEDLLPEQVLTDLRLDFPDGRAKLNWLGHVVIHEGPDILVSIVVRNNRAKVRASLRLILSILGGLGSGNYVAESASSGVYEVKQQAIQKYSGWIEKKYRIAEQ